MRFVGHAVAISLAVLLGCGHTRTVTDGDGKGPGEATRPKGDQPTKSAESAGAGEGGGAGKDAKKKDKGTAVTTPHGVPLASSPAGLLKPGAERRIADKLSDDGLLKSDKRGSLDDPTREALRRFQDKNDLPATGFPDHETVRKLGLDPDEIFTSKSETKPKQPSH